LHFNYRCHFNAVHYAKKNNDEKIALVTYREEGDTLPCVHFVNYHGEKFIDNTLGFWACKCEYRFIRWVNECEFLDISDVLNDTKRMFKEMGRPLERLFGDLSN
jgi:hypothetical protein